MTQFKWLNGKKFRKLRSGDWVLCEKEPYRKYGSELVSIRVPKEMVPWLTELLDKLEQIETARRNICSNIYNVSPDYYLSNVVLRHFDKEVEDE